jgi:hypothetical protein
MLIGTLTIQFRLHGVFSKKEKRNLADKLKQRVRNKFNVAVAEIEAQESLDFLILAFITVANETRRVDSILSKVLIMLESITSEEIIDVSTEIFSA